MANYSEKVIYPKLSYEIVGAAFSVFNEIGWGLSEKQYQAALAKELSSRRLSFRREVHIPLLYKGEKLGSFLADFVVEEKVLLELKIVSKLGYAPLKQTLGYLKSAGLKLGILIYFTKDGIKYRRVLNSDV